MARPTSVWGKQVRAAMMGVTTDRLRVERQACRVSAADSDELALLREPGNTWWLARRVSARFDVWAYGDEDAAHRAFERELAQRGTGGESWREVTPAPAAEAASA